MENNTTWIVVSIAGAIILCILIILYKAGILRQLQEFKMDTKLGNWRMKFNPQSTKSDDLSAVKEKDGQDGVIQHDVPPPPLLQNGLGDLGDDPWCSKDPMVKNMMQRIDQFRSATLTENSLKRIHVKLSAEIRSLNGSNVSDEIACDVEFQVIDRPLGLYSFGVNLSVVPDLKKGIGTLHGDSVKWNITQNNQPLNGIKTTWLPSLSHRENSETGGLDMIRRAVLLFSPPLPVSEIPYKLETVYSVKNFLPRLKETLEDECAYIAAQGPVQLAEVVVYLPTEKVDGFKISLAPALFKTEMLKQEYIKPKPNFTGYGAKGNELPTGSKLSLKICPRRTI